MKVLITGASGQLGPFAIRAFMEQHDIVLMSRHKPDPAFAAFPWIQSDLTVYDDCRRAVQGVDAIQHLAAQPWPVDHPALRGRAAAQGIAFDATFQSNLVGLYLSPARRCRSQGATYRDGRQQLRPGPWLSHQSHPVPPPGTAD